MSAVDEAILHPAPAGVVIMPVEILPPFPEISIPEPVEDIVVPLPEYVMPLGDPFIAEPKAVDIVVPVVFISEVPMESPVAELAAPAIMVEIEPHVHVAVEIATDPVVSVEVLHQSTVKIEGAQLEEIRSAPPPRTTGWSPVQPHPVETSDSNTVPENKGWH